MEMISNYIEAKRLYYSNLQEVSNLTDEEKNALEAYLAFGRELSAWLSTKSHSIEQCLSYFESSLYMNIISKKCSDIFFKRNDELIDEDDMLYEWLKVAKTQSSDNPELLSSKPLLEKKAEKEIEGGADFFGIAPIELPKAIKFRAGFTYSFLYPCVRVLYYIINHKKYFQKFKEEISEYITEGSKILSADADNEIKQECISDLQIDLFGVSTFKEDLTHIVSLVFNIEQDYIKSINDILYSIVKLISTCKNNGVFTPKEAEIIGNILNQSFIKEDIDKVRAEILRYEQNSEVFMLPKDYFLKSVSDRHEEYLSGCQLGTYSDVEKFMELINYLGDGGYIENNKTTKDLLAYRLTGRLRPEIDGDLPKIAWHGNGAHGSSCIYLISCISDSKKKFESMKRFFEAEFPDKKPSSIAYSCPKAFRERLHELFPKIFKLKNSEQ